MNDELTPLISLSSIQCFGYCKCNSALLCDMLLQRKKCYRDPNYGAQLPKGGSEPPMEAIKSCICGGL